MFAADVLSRYPVGQPEPDDIDLAQEVDVAMCKVAAAIVHSPDVFGTTVEDIRHHSASDEQYQLLAQAISTKSFARSRSAEKSLIKDFHNVKDRLSIVDGLVTYTFESGAPRLVVPKSLRDQVVKNIHAAHQGEESVLARARNSVYWPGISKDIKQSCETCPECQEMAPSQAKEPLIVTEPSLYPFQKNGC